MKGRLIAIDGLDGSGKATQSKRLSETLAADGYSLRRISFPNYESKSSTLVKMYLNGELGEHADSTGPFAASSFFALDRYISYVTDWKRDYDEGKLVLADRYTSANAVHQLSKIPRGEWDTFLEWLCDFEYKKLGIPAPDAVIYLEMLPEYSLELINRRAEQTGRTKDIHELDPDYLCRSYEAAVYAADRLGWERVQCYDPDGILGIDEIAREVRLRVKHRLGI